METVQIETRREALRRLLTIARESGVRLGVDHAGDYWATSISEPGRLYPLTPESCGCRGFAAHHRCRHIAALWSHLGYFDGPEPHPVGAALPNCSTCMDAGLVDAARSRWIGGCQTGHRDEWTSAVPCPACAGSVAA
jgi:hypothetical protein